MIEHVFETITSLAQFLFILWPLFIVIAFGYAFQGLGGKGWWKLLLGRIHTNLLFTWLFLFVIWIITLFASLPTPSLLPEPFNSILFFLGFVLVISVPISKLRLLPTRVLARFELQEVNAPGRLSQITPNDFEELVAETYRALGNQATRTGQSGDHGVDVVVLTPKGERWIIQCKRFRDPVGESVIRELYGTQISEKADRGVLITSSTFTPSAESWAIGKPIDLVNGKEFLKLMEKARRKTKGTLFDRLVNWLRIYARRRATPAGLRAEPIRNTFPDTVYATQADNQNGTTKNAPFCPRCGIAMIPHPIHTHRNLFRCPNYPDCRTVVEKK